MKTVINTAEYGTECWTCNFEGYNMEGSLFSAEYDLHRTLCGDDQKLVSNPLHKQKHEFEENCRRNTHKHKHKLGEDENGNSEESETCCHEDGQSSESGFRIKNGKPVRTCGYRGCSNSGLKGLNTSCKSLFDWALNQEQEVKVTDKKKSQKTLKPNDFANDTDTNTDVSSECDSDIADIRELSTRRKDSLQPMTDDCTQTENELVNKEQSSERQVPTELKLKNIENKRLKFLKDKSFSSSNMLAKVDTGKKSPTEKVVAERAAQITEVRPRSHHFLW